MFTHRYPDSWYRDITSNKKFFSLAATHRGQIVGMIVAEIKSRTKVHKEVSGWITSILYYPPSAGIIILCNTYVLLGWGHLGIQFLERHTSGIYTESGRGEGIQETGNW